MASDSRMHKVVWTGDTLSNDPADGAWTTAYDFDPGKVFDLTLPLDQAPDGYKAMDERRATKVLLTL